MYAYEEQSHGVIIELLGTGREVFLRGDEATAFLREIHRAGQKEASKRANPNELKIRQHIMAAYFE
jgi:hypothetical protein